MVNRDCRVDTIWFKKKYTQINIQEINRYNKINRQMQDYSVTKLRISKHCLSRCEQEKKKFQ